MLSGQLPLRAAALLLLVASLAACGGGGGGDSGSIAPPGDGSPPPANTFNAVSISLVSPGSIRQEYAESEMAQDIPLYLQGSGDLQQLNGRTLYAIVVDPDSITGGKPAVQLGTQSVPGSNARINLGARVMDKPGHFQGDLQVHACLDPTCATALAGSPLRIPYDITVRPGLALSRQEIAVTVPFGELPPVQSVDADLPAGLSGWRADTSFRYLVRGLPYRTQASVTQTSAGKGRVDFQPFQAQPGKYQDIVDVSATVTTPRGTAVTQRRSITVTYTVTPSAAIDYVFLPAEARFTVPAGSGGVEQPRLELYNEGIGFSGMAPTVQYLSSPPTAAGNPLVNTWFNDTVNVAYPCSGPPELGAHRTCLPPGIYTARVTVYYLKGSSIVTAYWPVTMNITP